MRGMMKGLRNCLILTMGLSTCISVSVADETDRWGDKALVAEMDAAFKPLHTKSKEMDFAGLKSSSKPEDKKLAEKIAKDLETRLTALATKGNVASQCMLGVFYEGDTVGTKNPELSLKWTKQAAEAGHPQCERNYGLALISGKLGQPDVTGGIEWMKKASDHGDNRASFFLGYQYATGKVVPADLDSAELYANRAAKNGDISSMNILCVIHGKKGDLKSAYRECYIASELGDKDAQGNLAKIAEKLDKDAIAAEIASATPVVENARKALAERIEKAKQAKAQSTAKK